MHEDERIFHELALHATRHELLCGRGSVPGWPNPEGWRDFLLTLDDKTVCDCEHLGLHHHTAAWRDDMPATLRALCDAVRRASLSLRRRRAADVHLGAACCCSPAGPTGDSHRSRHADPLPLRQNERKAAQVQALAVLTASHLGSLAKPAVSRVVDVGCGRGHLTAELSRLLNVPALGIDRDAELLHSARTLYPSVGFEMVDVMAGQLVPLLREGDLVVGLHPCGLLGERIVEAVASLRGVALLMVPCCLHKQGNQPRPPRSALGRAAGLTLPCAALKKASMARNASSTVAPRRTRHALRALLLSRGVGEEELVAGKEMQGIQGKLAKRGLRAVADAALTLRNLPPATDAELAAIAAAASPGFEAQRRLSLLECVQGEMMELLVLLDRALALRDAGHAVDVVAAFGLSASDRNLAILANCSRRGGDDEPRRTSGFSSGT